MDSQEHLKLMEEADISGVVVFFKEVILEMH
jgi:hypothetical protein